MPDNPVQKTLEIVVSQIQELDRQAAEKKRTANDLARLLQQTPMFPDVDAGTSGVSTRSDEYYGLQMPEVIRSILEKRKRANLGAATVNEIYDGMVAGGYHFQTKNDAYAKRGIYGILAADPTFHKLPGGGVGLTAWYPAARLVPQQNGKRQKSGRERGHSKRTTRSKPGPKRDRSATENKTRLQQITQLLLDNGPMARKEIREKSRLPEGTVAYLLNEKYLKHQTDGRWYVHEAT